MTEQIPLKQRISEYIKEDRWRTKNRLPRWFYFAVGENGYYPTMKEFSYRFIFKSMIFTVYISFIIWIIFYGVNTPVFLMIQKLALLLNVNELIWISYGTVLGMAGSLIFQNVRPGESMPSYFINTFIFSLYFAGFFIIINLILWISIVIYY